MFIFSLVLSPAASLGFSKLPPFIQKYISAHPHTGDGLLDILEGKFETHPFALLEESVEPVVVEDEATTGSSIAPRITLEHVQDPVGNLACQNGGKLSADGNSCDCGSTAYSGIACSLLCSNQGDLNDKGRCECYSGYFGSACHNSIAAKLAELATYCSRLPDMSALGAAGVQLSQAQSALLSLCPLPKASP
jgi:hypothetical protein